MSERSSLVKNRFPHSFGRGSLIFAQNRFVVSKRYFVSGILVLLIIAADQISKSQVISQNIPHLCNSGFAFGILQGILAPFISLLVLLVIIYSFFKSQRLTTYLALAIVIGGGMGNMVDRVFRGCVIDFIDLKVWPSFNLADAAITIGAAILIFSLLKLWPLK